MFNHYLDILSEEPSLIGMDIVIISTTSKEEELYWQDRLEKTQGDICKKGALILSVYEDWKGGAGNGLGTLYAIAKASLKAKSQGVHLFEKLSNGASVALYHTAGKGTRLSPLPGSEINNKPSVKLPATIALGDKQVPITILEAVIRQTKIFAPSRAGRISVFWGDQIFIPSVNLPEASVAHIDILTKLQPLPDAKTWESGHYDRYGLITVADDLSAKQVEKISHNDMTELISGGHLSVSKGVGISLGSFSLSYKIAYALLNEFSKELELKEGKLDTDPHFWMPMTLDEKTYLTMMQKKNESLTFIKSHYQRIQNFLKNFKEIDDYKNLFSAVDVGSACYWWDYGTLAGYQENNLKLLQKNDEAAAMRKFFMIKSMQTKSELSTDLSIDDNSLLINCHIKSGEIENSVLVNVIADRVDIGNSILINVAAPDISGEELILYNVVDKLSLQLDEQTVRADAFIPGTGHFPMWTNLQRDGKDDWNVQLNANKLSYDELNKKNTSCSMVDVNKMRDKLFSEIINILTLRF